METQGHAGGAERGGSAACVSIVCRRGRIEARCISVMEALAAIPGDEDLFWNRVTGEFVAKPRAEKPIRHVGEIPGVGDNGGTRMVRMLMYRAGAPVHGRMMNQDAILQHITGNAVSGLIRRIRKALGESGARPWFILTDEQAYRWSIDRSWRYIAAVDELDDFDIKFMPRPPR